MPTAPVISRSAEGASVGASVEVLFPSVGSKMDDAMVVVNVPEPKASGAKAPEITMSWVAPGRRSASVQVITVAVVSTQDVSAVVIGAKPAGTVIVTTGAVAVDGPPL